LTDVDKDELNFVAQTNLKLDTSNSSLGIKAFVHNTNKTNCWTLHFDSSKSWEGAGGVGCILHDPKGIIIIIACRLEFECINNTVEYEALLHGLRKAIDLKVKHIKVFGDSEIVAC